MSGKKIEELIYWLAIHRMPGVGAQRFAQLLAQGALSFYFNEKTPTHTLRQWCHQQGVNCVLDWQGVETDLAWLQKGTDRYILTWEDENYPVQLKQISGAPPLLFVEGNVNLLQKAQIALVGSRSPTTEGRQNAYHFAYSLAQQGWVITSGLALGVDGESHQGALAALGETIAVLGSGLDQIYPAQHKQLSDQIKAQGALVSEFPLGTAPKASHFPRRNRLISGLAWGVLIIESALKSGSLITARYALEQGREIFTLPGSIHNPLAKGNHQLIRQGAKCVDNVEHILEEFPLLLQQQIGKQVKQLNQMIEKDERITAQF